MFLWLKMDLKIRFHVQIRSNKGLLHSRRSGGRDVNFIGEEGLKGGGYEVEM